MLRQVCVDATTPKRIVSDGGAPVSVQVGSDPTSAPRYYSVYNAHGDVVDLTDTNANLVATYSYDSWGNLTSSNETFTNGWTNPYRYDGRDGARYDAATGLYWLSVRTYDPTLGRFLSRDPLGRAPLFFADNPYVYAGNNPLSNVDPSGQRAMLGTGAAEIRTSWQMAKLARMAYVHHFVCNAICRWQIRHGDQQHAHSLAGKFAQDFKDMGRNFTIAAAVLGVMSVGFAFLEQWELVAFVAGMTAAFGALASIAGAIADDFTVEESYSDSWFTKADLRGFGGSLQATLDREFGPWVLGVLLPTVTNASGFIIFANFIKDIARGDKLAGAGQLLLYGALGYMFTLVGGYIYMQHVMEADVAQQEADVLD